MPECRKYENYINLYIDDNILERELLELLEHIDECPICKKYYLELKAIKENLRNVKTEYPLELTQKILDGFNENKSVQVIQYKNPKFKGLYVALASCAVFALLMSSSNLVSRVYDTVYPDTAVAEAQSEDNFSRMSYSNDIDNDIQGIIIDEYAFVYSFAGDIDIPEINGKVIYAAEDAVFIEVENKMPVIEQCVSILEKNNYYSVIEDINNFTINQQSEVGMFIIYQN